MKTLLIVWAGQTGNTYALAQACQAAALATGEVKVRMLAALDAGSADLLLADAFVFATPENFGYMAGALKHFFDCSFYPCEGQLAGKPYALLVSAGNDGRGAVASVERIVRGWGLKAVEPALIVRAGDSHGPDAATELGFTLANAMALGIY